MEDRRFNFLIIYGIALLLLLGGFFAFFFFRGRNGQGASEDAEMAGSTVDAAAMFQSADTAYDVELSIENDWTGTEEHANGIWRKPYITQSDIEYSSSIPPVLDYTVEAFQIADMTAETQEMADYLSLPLNTTATFIEIKFTFWNIYGKDFYFYPSRAVMMINGEKSYSCREELCESMGKLYRQRSMKSGELYFLLEDMDKDEIEQVDLLIPAPTEGDGGGKVLGKQTRILFDIIHHR